MKKYIVPEGELRELLTRSLRLAALEHGGVDNWEWYSDSINDFINGWVLENPVIDDDEEFYLENIAEIELELYEVYNS